MPNTPAVTATLTTDLATTVTVIDAYGRAHVPVLLKSDPRNGQVEPIRSIAAQDDLLCETVLGSIREPADLADLAGLPVVTDAGMVLEPPAWAKRLCAADGGYPFLDELMTFGPVGPGGDACRWRSTAWSGTSPLPPGTQSIRPMARCMPSDSSISMCSFGLKDPATTTLMPGKPPDRTRFYRPRTERRAASNYRCRAVGSALGRQRSGDVVGRSVAVPRIALGVATFAGICPASSRPIFDQDRPRDTCLVTSQPTPTGLQRWLFRNRRPVRVGCAVFLLVLVGWAVYSFSQGMIVWGVLSVLICMSPISLWQSTRSVERLVAQHQVKTD